MIPSLLLVLVTTLSLISAAPTLVYPLQDQLPPIARVGKPFVFDLISGTFTSTSSVTLTASTLPSWLTFNPATAEFAGTPTSADIGQQEIVVFATDPTGTSQGSWTLIVTDLNAPEVHAGFTTQIANPSVRVFASATVLPGGTGVQVPPYWSFSLGWQADTFRLSRSANNGQMFIAARLRGTASLPSWLDFNNATMTFSGVAPASGSYAIVVTAADFYGYTAAQSSFVIQVGEEGASILELAGPPYNVGRMVGTARTKVSGTVDLSKVTVSGAAVDSSQIKVAVNGSEWSWLSIDSSRTISGIIPDQYINGTASSLTIPLTLSYNGATSLSTMYLLDVTAYPFIAFSLPTASTTPGAPYSLNLLPYLRNRTTSISAVISPADAAKWLTYNSQAGSLSGTVPQSPGYSSVNVTFTASSGLSKRQQQSGPSASLRINLSGVTSTGSATGTASVPTSSGTASSSSSSGGASAGGLSQQAKIGLGVGLGILALLLLLLLLFCCCRRRRQNDDDDDRPRKENDGDSFVAGPRSPTQDPFRKSSGLEPPRNILGQIANIWGSNPSGNQNFPNNMDRSPVDATSPQPTTTSFETTKTYVNGVYVEKAKRIDGLKGIFGHGSHGDDHEKAIHVQEVTTPQLPRRSSSFLAHGDVIGVNDPVNRVSQGASSFTHTFGSSGSSRASWESQRSYQWSSEGHGAAAAAAPDTNNPNRVSAAPSIPRPRENFTPRYPRANSPRTLSRLTSGRKLDDSPDFSEFASDEEVEHGRDNGFSPQSRRSGKSRDSMGFSRDFQQAGMYASERNLTSSDFPSGPSGLNRFGESRDFRTEEDEDEEYGTDMDGEGEGPAVVTMAERQSFETRRPSTKRTTPRAGQSPAAGAGAASPNAPPHHGPKLRPSKERITSQPVTGNANTPRSSQALGMFDDAEENRKSTYAPQSPGGESEVNGLGYPASAIYFSTPDPNNRISQMETTPGSQRAASTIQAVSPDLHRHPISPPLPAVGQFTRGQAVGEARSFGAVAAAIASANAAARSSDDRPRSSESMIPEMRLVAIPNETFSIHPQINPPPTVSLSAATWSSAPPSTYRAEVIGGGQLPAWLHFDNRELELWGVPNNGNAGEVTVIKIVERMPRDKRNSNPGSYGYQPVQEREVGRVTIEVSDRMRSPQFALENSPHAM